MYENLLTWFTNTGAHRWKGQAIVCKKSLLVNPGFSSPLNLMLSLGKLLNFFFLSLVKQEFCPCPAYFPELGKDE